MGDGMKRAFAAARATRRSPRKKIDAEIVSAGDAFRKTLLPRADDASPDGSPLWHGWALMDAFVAGAEWANSKKP